MRSLTNSGPWARRRTIGAILVCCTAMCFAQAGSGAGDESSEIVIRGSKNLLQLVETWTDASTQGLSTATFDIEAVGTSEGIDDLLAGRAHLAMASRSMSEEERLTARTKDLKIRETVVARMGIAVIVNKENTVESLTIGNLAAIFSGESNNWQAVGGPDQPIIVVHKVSGWSPAFFSERIMGGAEFSDDAIIADSKEDVVTQVGSRPWSIGFTGMQEAIPARDRISLIRIVSPASGGDATYALSRPLYFYTIEGEHSVEPFLDFVTGPEAQQMIVDTGFFSADQTDDVTED